MQYSHAARNFLSRLFPQRLQGSYRELARLHLFPARLSVWNGPAVHIDLERLTSIVLFVPRSKLKLPSASARASAIKDDALPLTCSSLLKLNVCRDLHREAR
jgi:hypothetical protein